jgi:hypothetical protein
LDPSSEISIGHAFYWFKLKFFCGYFLCAPKSRKNIEKKLKKVKSSQKNNDTPKNRKIERDKRGTIFRGAHRGDSFVIIVGVYYLVFVSYYSCYPSYLFLHFVITHLVLGTR